AESPLECEAAHEASLLDRRQHLGCDAAAHVNPTDRHALQRQVARLGAIDKGKQVERRLAKAVLSGEADLRDDRALVSGAQLLGEPGRLGGEAAVAQE